MAPINQAEEGPRRWGGWGGGRGGPLWSPTGSRLNNKLGAGLAEAHPTTRPALPGQSERNPSGPGSGPDCWPAPLSAAVPGLRRVHDVVSAGLSQAKVCIIKAEDGGMAGVVEQRKLVHGIHRDNKLSWSEANACLYQGPCVRLDIALHRHAVCSLVETWVCFPTSSA